MAYKRIQLIIKSIFAFLEDVIEAEGYIIGEEEGKMGLYDSFQVKEFNLPAISIDFVMSNPMREADLGHHARRSYPIAIDIFARTKIERDGLLSAIIDALEKNLIPFMDYNQATPVKTKLIWPENVEGSTVRIATVGEEEENRGVVRFDATIEDEY